MSEHRESRKTGAGRSILPGAWAVVTAGGARQWGSEWYVFEAGTTNPAALRAQLERLRPRPLKAQCARTSGH
jgi:hypothetical protein